MHTPLPPDASEPPNSTPNSAVPGANVAAARALTPALDQPVSMIMTTGDLITADVSDDVAVAIEIFRQGRISHIPVLSEGSKLVGVVSPADILKLSTQLVPPFVEATARRGTAAVPHCGRDDQEHRDGAPDGAPPAGSSAVHLGRVPLAAGHGQRW